MSDKIKKWCDVIMHNEGDLELGTRRTLKMITEEANRLFLEIERLNERDGNASIVLLCPTNDDPLRRERLNIVDFGVSDNVYIVS